MHIYIIVVCTAVQFTTQIHSEVKDLVISIILVSHGLTTLQQEPALVNLISTSVSSINDGDEKGPCVVIAIMYSMHDLY